MRDGAAEMSLIERQQMRRANCLRRLAPRQRESAAEGGAGRWGGGEDQSGSEDAAVDANAHLWL